MNKRSIISVLLFVLSAAFAVWFIFQLVIDYTVLYPHGSAPFYVYVLARLLDRLLPAAILLAAGIAVKRKK